MIDLAHRFVEERFTEKKGIVGVLLRGSAVIGIQDRLADLDLDVIVDDESIADKLAVWDATSFGGVEVSWGYKSFAGVEAELHDWLRDTDLWAYSKSKVMLDRTGRIKALLDWYKQYPAPVREEKMFSYFYYATAASPYNSDKSIQRHDYLTAQLFLTNAIELYTALLYLVNKSFIPYRKWRIHQLATLPRKPDRFIERMSDILFEQKLPTRESLLEKQRTVMEIMNSIRSMLLQEGVDSQKVQDDLWRYEPKYLPSI